MGGEEEEEEEEVILLLVVEGFPSQLSKVLWFFSGYKGKNTEKNKTESTQEERLKEKERKKGVVG